MGHEIKHGVPQAVNLELGLELVRMKFFTGFFQHIGVTFAQERVHSVSLSWLYICLHDTTTKCHVGASNPGVSSPRFLYRGENFPLVRNLAMVSCKHKTTSRFGVKSVCR